MIKKIHSNTAILLFAQTAKADALHKPLANNAALMDVLNKKVTKTAKASGFDFYHFTEAEQRGVGFGTRFSNSVQDVFDKGYDSIICLGNDTPLLTVKLIQDAADALKKGKAAKGKSLDGGLYLIALHKNNFDASAFRGLPWQSSNLAVAFHQYITVQNQELEVLEPLADLDTEQDLEGFLSGKDARCSIIRLILSTLSRKQNNYQFHQQQTISVISLLPLNKGSPKAA
ncbi:hypothetical protein LX97_00775 [Nonlabens dokdonensis]|jgi:glycosyltransferase A (GT-A) superfamily protein (DUF2064 family)|uniref:DUF2064 domain containing protein n=2 Tax=Nonlabens dokdonensis TaxID=328515 RepID=L7W3H7_NONDD|nr:DUF2064 domain-containing protein [Nonlabens dokdonensis]AGC76100.1 DUF2064 domain containing protein [Nonlabens dokdonensis DSW-6]PZX43771.1 hypothetical protein LX97_00775 [Nonlabens dokdonensis]